MDTPTPALTDTAVRQLTVRAVLTGMVLGAVLSTCNIYAGLKIGWAFNMSIAAALLSYGFWGGLHKLAGTPKWGLLENNINQTTASAAASIAGAGLVAPIPALTLLTGQTFGWGTLAIWTFTVSVLGVVVAVGLRRQLLEVDELAFPQGVATAETIREMYAQGAEAAARIRVLLAGGGLAAGLKLFSEYVHALPLVGLPGALAAAGRLPALGLKKISAYNLTFAFDPSLLMVAFGAIIGLRAATSLLIGAILAWGVLGPWAIGEGHVQLCATAAACAQIAQTPWYTQLLDWLLWPGVTMMVTASLTSFAFSWRSIAAALARLVDRSPRDPEAARRAGDVPRRLFLWGLLMAFIIALLAEWLIFDISPWLAAFGVGLTFLLAVVAGRVSGETGITPIGAMGQVTQLTFGGVAPGDATANLMAANVTGGAASQCADMLHDLKTGLIIGAQPKLQAAGQACGILAGALAGSAVYLILLPDPQGMLLTPEFPAPAVATWKAVAEVFMAGWGSLPTGAAAAMVIAGLFGVLTAALEKMLPPKAAQYVPSSASIGLAFVLPAWLSISMFLGAGLAALLGRAAPRWSTRFILVLAAGVVAGESLAGVLVAALGVLGVGG